MPPILSSETVNIGTSYQYELSSYFTNGDCIYSTGGDANVPWDQGSVYTKETLSLTASGYAVQSVATTPKLVIYVVDNNYAGTYTYYFTYTDYKS